MSTVVGMLVAAQALLAVRVGARFLRTARGSRIVAVRPAPGEGVAIVVPVLDEADRIDGCLAATIAQGDEVLAILVVDGGSRDGTQARVAAWARRDARVRLVEAPPPASWTGKAWGWARGLERVPAAASWVLFVDADVRVGAGLARAAVAHAVAARVDVLSVAARQRVAGALQAIVHPALLASLVYRTGIPGGATRRTRDVQVNGQCLLARVATLRRTGAIDEARASLCEDVTIARALATAGVAVGFYESDVPVIAKMYATATDAWRNWPRSLVLLDDRERAHAIVGLAEVALVQAAPTIALAAAVAAGAPAWLVAPEALLVAMRFGVLAGLRRAYVAPAATYWLSPLLDLPAACALVLSALRSRHRWRGRTYARRGARWIHVEDHPA